MACGRCSASCPARGIMDVPPHKFVKYTNEKRTEECASSNTIRNCLSCYTCAARCPRGVGPVAVINEARLAVLRKIGGEIMSQDDVPNLILNDENIPQQLIVAAMRKYR